MSKQAFVALVTCFNEDETINYEATRAQVRRQVAAGNNIMCAGTNGDFTALTHAEKIRLTEEVVDEVAGRAKVIVNAGMPATFETLQLAKAFDRIGVDGIAVITPFFIACTQDGLIRHFSTVADAVCGPGTTSTSGMMCAGLSQWAMRKRSGPSTASARCDGEIVELVDATRASGPMRPASCLKMSRLSSTDSGSASCTKVQSRKSPRPTRSSMRPSADASSSAEMTASSTISRASRPISTRASASTVQWCGSW